MRKLPSWASKIGGPGGSRKREIFKRHCVAQRIKRLNCCCRMTPHIGVLKCWIPMWMRCSQGTRTECNLAYAESISSGVQRNTSIKNGPGYTKKELRNSTSTPVTDF